MESIIGLIIVSICVGFLTNTIVYGFLVFGSVLLVSGIINSVIYYLDHRKD